jgi:hypothetical protein
MPQEGWRVQHSLQCGMSNLIGTLIRFQSLSYVGDTYAAPWMSLFTFPHLDA